MKNEKRWLKALGGAALTFAALDAVWIGGVAKKIYDKNIPHLMAAKINAAPAGLFYAGYLGAPSISRSNPTRRTELPLSSSGTGLPLALSPTARSVSPTPRF